MRRATLVFTLGSVLLASPTARAQEAGRVGVSAGYPGTIGLLWHVTERIAVRPGVSVSQGSSGFAVRS